MNNAKLIDQLKSNRHERAFKRLYSNYPKVEAYIRFNSGSKDEALDIFQDALVVLYKKVNDFATDSNIKVEGFLVNTCKLLWSNELRKKKVRKNEGSEGLVAVEYEDEIGEILEKEAKYDTIDRVIKKLGVKCKKMLNAFYYKRQSMEDIAKAFGYKSVQSAKTRKYKCMEQAREMAGNYAGQTLKETL